MGGIGEVVKWVVVGGVILLVLSRGESFLNMLLIFAFIFLLMKVFK